jgi:hypothetical protein
MQLVGGGSPLVLLFPVTAFCPGQGDSVASWLLSGQLALRWLLPQVKYERDRADQAPLPRSHSGFA